MNPVRSLIRLAVLPLLLSPSRLAAHGDVHLQIAVVSGQILRHPSKAELFLERARLELIDGNWTNALSDAAHVARLSPQLREAHHIAGRAYLLAGDWNQATNRLGQYLVSEPKDAAAHHAMASALSGLHLWNDAAHSIAAAIRLAAQPGPDLFLQWSEALKKARLSQEQPPRDSPNNTLSPFAADEALAALKAGIDRLGSIESLEEASLDLEEQSRQWQRALLRVERLRAKSERREYWLAREARILKSAGRLDDARQAWRQLLTEIGDLPVSIRQRSEVQRLKEETRRNLESSHSHETR